MSECPGSSLFRGSGCHRDVQFFQPPGHQARFGAGARLYASYRTNSRGMNDRLQCGASERTARQRKRHSVDIDASLVKNRPGLASRTGVPPDRCGLGRQGRLPRRNCGDCGAAPPTRSPAHRPGTAGQFGALPPRPPRDRGGGDGCQVPAVRTGGVAVGVVDGNRGAAVAAGVAQLAPPRPPCLVPAWSPRGGENIGYLTSGGGRGRAFPHRSRPRPSAKAA